MPGDIGPISDQCRKSQRGLPIELMRESKPIRIYANRQNPGGAGSKVNHYPGVVRDDRCKSTNGRMPENYSDRM